MTIFAGILFPLWRIHHLERNGEYLNFLKGDSRGFFSGNLRNYVTGSSGKISALYDFFSGHKCQTSGLKTDKRKTVW